MRINASHIDTTESDYYSYVPTHAAASAFNHPLIVGALHFTPGYNLRHRTMDNYMIAYIREGTFHFQFGGQDCTADAGKFILIDCRHRHDFWTDTHCSDWYLHFNGPSVPFLYNYITTRSGNVIAPFNPSQIITDMGVILDLFRTGSVIDEASVSHRIDGILTGLAQASSNHDTQQGSAVIRNIIAYISEHLEDDLSLDLLGQIACISKFHLAKLFKTEIGMAPHHYILNARIERAKYLLAYTNSTVQRIGRECGFNQPSSFCTAFKKHTGCSPTEYRRHILGLG